ncbi:hypothetical protein, partial [Arcanobacterium phocae]|uniref:hypothetical protein n=1 Tax=Arcanobacterium phocae TaxID=131112 RepID=UPI001C0E9103
VMSQNGGKQHDSALYDPSVRVSAILAQGSLRLRATFGADPSHFCPTFDADHSHFCPAFDQGNVPKWRQTT